MGLLDRFRGSEPQYKLTDLQEVMANYDLVDVNADAGYMIVTERGANKALAEEKVEPRPADGRQLIGEGTTKYGRNARLDYNPEFAGDAGIAKYMEMRNDAQVRSSMRIAKTPVLGARWFVAPYSNEPRDVEAADHIRRNLMVTMTTSWPQLLVESMLMLDYGYYAFEKVFKIVEGLVWWDKFIPIHPIMVQEAIYSKEGGPAGLKLFDENKDEGLDIDITKLLVFTFDKEAGDITGSSLLRSAYKHWFYKENLYKIDAIQKERHGIGIPIIKLPVGFKTQDRNDAHIIGRNLRTNENAHVIMPPGWEILFAKLEGQRVDALESAKHHGDMLYENIVANFMLGNDSGETREDMFQKSSRFIAEIIRDVWNKFAIPQLCKWNWTDLEGFPELKVRRLGDSTDWRTVSFAYRNFAGAGALTPTLEDEIWIRDEMDLAPFNEDNVRDIQPKQVTGSGLPKQSPAATQDSNSNKSNVGMDKSGG